MRTNHSLGRQHSTRSPTKPHILRETPTKRRGGHTNKTFTTTIWLGTTSRSSRPCCHVSLTNFPDTSRTKPSYPTSIRTKKKLLERPQGSRAHPKNTAAKHRVILCSWLQVRRTVPPATLLDVSLSAALLQWPQLNLPRAVPGPTNSLAEQRQTLLVQLTQLVVESLTLLHDSVRTEVSTRRLRTSYCAQKSVRRERRGEATGGEER